jgi:hypothetical protein
LHYGKLNALNSVLLVVGGVLAYGVVALWVDAITGPRRHLLSAYHSTAKQAADTYDELASSFDPVRVRVAILDRLRSEEALARRELGPREESLRMSAWLATFSLFAFALLGLSLLFGWH